MAKNVDIARDLSLTAFLERELGVQAKRMGRHARFNYCPDCGNEGHQPNKLQIQIDDKHYFCHRCRDKGTVIDAAMKLWGMDFGEAVDRLAGNHSGDVKAKPVDMEKVKKEDTLRNQKIAEVLKRLKPIFADSADDFKCIQYLTKVRKLPLEVVREAQKRGMLAFMPSNVKNAESRIIKACGEQLLRDAGMWKEGAKRPSICYRPIVFILPGETSAEFRIIGEPKPDMLKSMRFGTNIPYPFVWRSKTPSTKVAVVEGAIDTLSMVALGTKSHIVGIPGCNNWDIEWFIKIKDKLQIEEFVLALDNDSSSEKNPGQKGQERLVEAMNLANLKNSRKVLPENSDINEILKARSVA